MRPPAGLRERHIRFIALGGAIGAGLFLGSGAALHSAGPTLLAAYAASGLAVFMICRAMGELILARPSPGAFADYATDFIGPWAGYFTGWSYWLIWMLAGIAEITAAGVFMRFWFPDLPQWVTALCAVAVLGAVNLTSTRLFGELEFWLVLVKVLTVIALILGGAFILLTGFHRPPQAGPATLIVGGLLPHGWGGLLHALPIAIFGFGGVEMIGLAVQDGADPRRSAPKVINGVIWRILVFYIGALAVIMMIFPWTQLDPRQSPFVAVFASLGLPAAAGVINAVVLTAALSSCNSGLYSASRMLAALARQGQAPSSLAARADHRVPTRAVLVSIAGLGLGVALNYALPDRAFGYLVSALAALILWIWGVILVSHLRYRRRLAALGQAPGAFAMPGGVGANVATLGFLVLVAAILALDPASQMIFAIAAGWFALLAIIYRLTRPR
uniref:Amino acid permease-associated region n=1 Tax=Caulobacter sp. (strain K31) TaxID=366602 RepID=B0T9J7_CAUSK